MNFKVGQTIVCIDDKGTPAKHPKLKEGKDYTCAGYSQFGDVLLEEFPYTKTNESMFYGYDPCRFILLQPLYSDITAELASQGTIDETSDQPMRVLSN